MEMPTFDSWSRVSSSSDVHDDDEMSALRRNVRRSSGGESPLTVKKKFNLISSLVHAARQDANSSQQDKPNGNNNTDQKGFGKERAISQSKLEAKMLQAMDRFDNGDRRGDTTMKTIDDQHHEHQRVAVLSSASLKSHNEWPPARCRSRPVPSWTAGAQLAASLRELTCCNTLSLLIIMLLVFAAHTSASGQHEPGQPWTGQQVDARLIPLAAADNGEHRESGHWIESAESGHELQLSGAKISKRFATGALSSAEMPAEFRGSDSASETAPIDQPREQSRLAKLCQQTSSVLASVLPAPFGGHKRSILCQFFGQVHVGGAKRQNLANVNMPAAVGPSLSPNSGQYGAADNHLSAASATEQGSIAILQQHMQAPVAMLATGKHPIQMVLEHQQRQAALASLPLSSNLPIRMPVINAAHLMQPQMSKFEQQLSNTYITDLSKDASFRYQTQRPTPTKFSAPLETSPAVSQTSPNSNQWRIFNVTLFAANSPQGGGSSAATSASSSSSTTPIPSSRPSESSSIGSTTSATSLAAQETKKESETSHTTSKPKADNSTTTGRQTGRVGKRTSDSNKKSPSDKQHELVVAESRQASDPQTGDVGLDGVRTIEVVAQSASSSNPQQPGGVNQTYPSTAASTIAGKQANTSTTRADVVQKREELVIASINNLTRIAFGNHLRDTVKVINKLIDQQAEFFNGSSRAKSARHESSFVVDPMQTSESINGKQMVPMMMVPLKVEKGFTKSGVTAKAREHQKLATTSPAKFAAVSDKKTTTKKSNARRTSITRKPEAPKPTTRTADKTSPGQTKRTPAAERSPFKPAIKSSSTLELKRLTTIGRSLVQQNNAADSTRRPSSTTKSSRSLQSASAAYSDELDLTPAQSVQDLRRDPKSGSSFAWVPSSGPTRLSSGGDKSSGPVLRKLRDEFARPPVRSTTMASPTTRRAVAPNSPKTATDNTSSLTPRSSSSLSPTTTTTVTRFPWLLPDRSATAGADLFSAASQTATSIAQIESRSSPASDMPKKWTTRRMIVGPSETTDNQLTTSTAKASSRAINGLEQKKPDSLTTLKMAVTRARTTQSLIDAKSPSDRPTTKVTPLPFSAGSSTQSRWIPSTMFETRQSASVTIAPTTSALLATTTAASTVGGSSASLSSSSDTSKASTASEIRANSIESVASTASLSDLNEARASETISKYTTHLNDANELVASTKRHFIQPLPQIANTGDFFSAETIASWPEKYQTMISRAMETGGEDGKQFGRMSTTSSFETTRRNGESYDHETSKAAGTTLARHRPEVATTQTARDRLPTILGSSPGLTILPSNHKLGSSLVFSDNSISTVPMTQTTSGNVQTATESPSSFADLAMTSQTKQLPPYTLIDQIALTSSAPSTVGAPINQTTVSQSDTISSSVYYGLPTFSRSNRTGQTSPTANLSTNESLRPPYQDNHDQVGEDLQLSDPTLVLDSTQSRPHVSRKLYELLVPTNQNFVGVHNPLNRQRFNWSALKYMAQNILSSGKNSAGNATQYFNSSEPYDLSSTTLASDQQYLDGNQQQDNNNVTQAKLFELIGKTNYAPTNYYDLASNESSSWSWPFGLQSEFSAANSQGNSTSGKGLFERASNLLSEMKQLEQKRAAALLAAFRYQVPGPLVRPWDLASDLQTGRDLVSPLSTSISRFFADRFDGSDNKRLTTGQLLNAMKSAVKQKFVARDELEARLNRRSSGDKMAPPHLSSNWRRDDSTDESVELPLGGGSPAAGNSTRTLENLEYVMGHNGTDLASQPRNVTNNQINKLQAMLDNLLEAPIAANSTNLANQSQGDFDLIDLSNKSSSEVNQTDIGYKRLVDHHTMSDYKQVGGRPKLVLPKKQSIDMMAEERLSTASNYGLEQETEAEPTSYFKGQKTKSRPDGELNQDKERENEFSCEERPPGFYPDAISSCGTFYHCSNTGHLLTFSCPSSTRFDEKSLKCGPWYEVPCDVSRTRSRRY